MPHLGFVFDGLRLEGRLHHRLVFTQAPDDGVLIDKLELLLGRRLPLEQLAKDLQSEGAVAGGGLTRFLDAIRGVLLGQVQQAHQHPHTLDAALLEHLLGPLAGVGADPRGLAREPRRAQFHAGDLLVDDVLAVRAELAGRPLAMYHDLPHALVEDSDQPGVEADPHLMPQVLRRHRVVGLVHLDVTVAMDGSSYLGE